MSRPDSTADEARLAIGTVVGGRYRIERVIGAGGMGFVYAARHEQLGELVAVKTLHLKQLGEPEAIERFLREAKACAKIKNDHVVRVLDVSTGEGGSAPYIVMEFLEGQDLGSLVASPAQLSVTNVVDYVLQACEAFAEAHARGIIHRDIKPSNLFLCKRGDGTPMIKVVDFGISKALVQEGDNASLTATREVFGSPAYMSPEQVRSAKRVDARSDIWSLGVLLFELLTKVLPFEGETSAGILAAISADEPRSIRDLRADVPEGLGAVVLACLRKNRDERTQSVADLALALRPFASLEGQRSVDTIAKQNPITSTVSLPPPEPSAELAYGATERGLSTTTSSARPRKAIYVGAAAGVALVGLVIAGAIFVRPIFLRSNRVDGDTLASPSQASPQITTALSTPTTPLTDPPTPAISSASPSASAVASTRAPLAPVVADAHRPANAVHVGVATKPASPPVSSSSSSSSSASSPSSPPSAPPPSNASDLDLNRRY